MSSRVKIYESSIILHLSQDEVKLQKYMPEFEYPGFTRFWKTKNTNKPENHLIKNILIGAIMSYTNQERAIS